MSVLNLFWIMFFVGGGVAIGGWAATHWLGYFVGGVIGFLVLELIARANARTPPAPPCKCGVEDWPHFSALEDDPWMFLYLSECGIRYTIRKGGLWFEIDDNDNATLTQIKPFCGEWRDPTEDEIAKYDAPRLREHD